MPSDDSDIERNSGGRNLKSQDLDSLVRFLLNGKNRGVTLMEDPDRRIKGM